ncbi:hypothetical protein [Microbacterium dextranolyticum]|nr:hypothetical protein [Microbacterium dextranolyticum]MBM7463554.1 hypothetical protein [Microbacterium dextranolyticum]
MPGHRSSVVDGVSRSVGHMEDPTPSTEPDTVTEAICILGYD